MEKFKKKKPQKNGENHNTEISYFFITDFLEILRQEKILKLKFNFFFKFWLRDSKPSNPSQFSLKFYFPD